MLYYEKSGRRRKENGMKFLCGYQLTETDGFLRELLRRQAEGVLSEVYFSYGTMPNGRHAAAAHETMTEWEAMRRTDEDLAALSRAGVCFNLLLNGSCYGGRSLSRQFLLSVCDTVDDLGARFGLSSVTTTSPVLADVVKKNFPELEIRASVNMEIGSAAGIDYLADRFDSFYLAREHNRDLETLRFLSCHCKALGKNCYLLANSGCLRNCSARQFHDNLVAHEREIAEMNNGASFSGICGPYLDRAEDKSVLLSRLTFIRPEDVSLYEGLCDGMKLAARVSRYPAQILSAYAEGHYSGNLLDLLEPDHAEHLYPDVIENTRLPSDFGTVTASCGHVCERGGDCSYCRDAFARAKVRIGY